MRYENVNEKINCKRRNHSELLVQQMYISFPSIVSNITNSKMNFEKPVGLTSFQKPTNSVRFNLLQVCPSVPTFVFPVLSKPSLNVLHDYFYV